MIRSNVRCAACLAALFAASCLDEDFDAAPTKTATPAAAAAPTAETPAAVSGEARDGAATAGTAKGTARPEEALATQASATVESVPGRSSAGSRSATGEDGTATATKPEPPPSPFVPAGSPNDPARRPGMRRLPSGVEYAILSPGTGPRPRAGAPVEIHLTGWLLSGARLGREFWSTRKARVADTWPLDSDHLIPGLVDALLDMRLGERRWLVVPSRLAYGEAGYDQVVPPATDLVLDVHLVRAAQ